MNIGLVHIDGKLPNLALMKLSAWHKQQGDTVQLLKPADILLGQSLFDKPDKVYAAVVFSENRYIAERLKRIGAQVGGTGWDLKNKLPEVVEKMFPDYSLYGETDTAYGFLTRGCPRGCGFCIVGEKEGLHSSKVANLSDFWNGQREIKLFDPNLLATTEWEDLLQQLIDSKSWIDFTQGLDIRLMTKRKAEMINTLKLKMVHFAWDNYEMDTFKRLVEFRDYFDVDYRKLKVYVLTNYNTTHEQDLDRVYKLVGAGYDPYVMIYDKKQAPQITRYLQRWVNNKIIFRSCLLFDDFDPKVG